MPASTDQLRAQLRRAPADWGVRLELAEALVKEGSGQQAAVLIATAPKDPPDVDAVLRAARLVMALDAKLAMRFTDRVLAQDEFNVAAALTRARIHQHRNEPEEAHRFAVVASTLDPAQCERETSLMEWLAAEGLPLELGSSGAAVHVAASVPEASAAAPAVDEPEAVEMALVEEEHEEEPVLAVIAEEEEEAVVPVVVAPEREEKTVAAPEPVVTKTVEKPVNQTVVVVAHEKPAGKAASAEAKLGLITPLVKKDAETTGADDLPPVITPRRNSHVVQKASAITVALVVHAALILLLGLLVVIVPEPPVAELVGIVAPDMVQEQPQTKQITPAAMPTPTAVAAAPARAITAAGVSSIALPDFESKAEGPQVMEIATTDLGASFAMPFSPKGTSQVNFFGIKSQGRRVAFLIDVERYMLTDPRGGYPAYEIVKNEIAGMIGKLGLDTHFNVILYEGTGISAYL
jgi:hypothetical protein